MGFGGGGLERWAQDLEYGVLFFGLVDLRFTGLLKGLF